MQPLTVYLDTSDYSRFGDVVRGCSDAVTERLYNKLLELRGNGSVQFAYSLPILSELLQHNPCYPTTTESKALAVEALCGKTAFFWPIRSVASDVSAYLKGTTDDFSCRPISFDSEWHPVLADEIGDLKKTLEDQLANELASRTFLNRGERRAAEAKVRKFRLTEVGPAIIEEVAKKYAIEPGVVARAVIPALEGKLSSAEGARRLAAAIAKPTAFVRNYFDPERNEARDLPTLISAFGAKMQDSLLTLRTALENHETEMVRQVAPSLISSSSQQVAESLLKSALDETAEFGVGPATISPTRWNELIANVPSLAMFKAAFAALLEQSSGLHGSGHTPEHSAGGDLMHLLYLPHCDLSRGDRRFSNVVKRLSAATDARVVARLTDLPERIESLLA